MRLIVTLVVGRVGIEVYILAQQLAQVITGPRGSFYFVQPIVGGAIGSCIDHSITGACSTTIHHNKLASNGDHGWYMGWQAS